MSALVLGPLALPINPLLLLMAFGLALMVAKYVVRQAGQAALQAVVSRHLTVAAVGGLISARVAYIAQGSADYLEQPWSMLNLRDGGWSLGWGLLGAGLTLAVMLTLASRRGMAGLQIKAAAIGVALGAGLWLMGSLPTGMWQQPTMPPLAVQALDGSTKTLAQWADGRPLIVNVWATWCPPCRAEMPDLERVQARLAEQARASGAVDAGESAKPPWPPTPRLLLINQGESAETVIAYLKRAGLAADGVMLDPHSAVGKATGTNGLPSTLFYDAQGRLIDRHFGPMSQASLLAKIRGLGWGR